MSVKFIIWDLYYTGKVDCVKLVELDGISETIIENLSTCLTRTLGNILYIDDNGKVSSVLKKVERRLKQEKDKVKREKKEKLDTIKIKKEVSARIILYLMMKI